MVANTTANTKFPEPTRFELADIHGALSITSERPDVVSVWHGHVSFAHWIVSILQPRTIVELGTHNGTSFVAFCNAVKSLNLETQCFAVDTWEGDPHAGYYDNYVYEELLHFNEKHFNKFSRLLRMTFAEANSMFKDGSVDLLHIDGLHTYEAVSNDFYSWLPKLSNKAVVLFHDTVVHHEDFGVFKLWDELKAIYPSFNFYHSAGLGVLAVGSQIAPELSQVLNSNLEESDIIRKRFELASQVAHLAGMSAIRSRSPKFLGDNIALNRPASQSSYLYTDGPTASAATNGVKFGGASFHSDYEADPWWKVDLGEVKTFEKVVIFNRIDPGCIARSRTLQILLSDDNAKWLNVYDHDGRYFGGVDGEPLVVGGVWSARYLMIKLRETNYLHLDEVEIYRSA